MKDEDCFSHEGPAPITSHHERSNDSDRSAPSSTYSVPQYTPSSAPLSRRNRRLTLHHHMRFLLVVMVGVLVVLAGWYGLFRTGSQPSGQASSAFQQTHCPFPVGAALVEGQNVRCGFLTVPEERSQPQGSTIRLAVAIFKTPNPRPAPDPVLVLGGGPGVPQLATFGSAINAGNIASFAPDRDYILLDQRGVGYSQPSLSCRANESLQMCHDRLMRERINLNAYTTLENAADVHDLVRMLGYKQVNLEGRSYGTRLALTVMRLYPRDLRSVVLISVLPPQVNGSTAQSGVYQHAFDVLFRGCAADPHCNTTYPHLQTVFYRLVTRLNKNPITFQAHDPQTGNLSVVRFTGDNLMFWLFNAMYTTTNIPQLPWVLFQISHQDYTQLSHLYDTNFYDTLSLGMKESVQCSEDNFVTPQALKASVQVLAPELRPGMLASLQEGWYHQCQIWNVKPVPAEQKEPVTSAIPTLILEGEYDPITPSANGMLAEQTLSRSFFFLFPGVSHGVQSSNPCPHDIEYAFLDQPTEKPEASCIKSMPEPDF